MNKRQVIILWIVAAVLAATIGFIKFGKEKETKSATNRAAGQTLLESFPATEVASVEIKGVDSSVSFVKKEGKWVLPQREDFPAKNAGLGSINELLRTVEDLKIAQGMQAGPSFTNHFGMDETSKEAKKHGINLIFKDASGKVLANITVGKNIESSAGSGVPLAGGGATGRFVRNHADESGFYAVNELFASLSDQVKSWLPVDEFLRIEKIQSISVTQPGKADIAWKAVRDNEDSDFTLEGAAAGEAIEPTTASALKSIFAFSRFSDVVTTEETSSRAIPDQKRVATIVTFEGFTYTITFTPSKAAEKPASQNPEDPSPPAEDTFLVSFTLDASIPSERKKEEGEKPEDAKAKDEAFEKRTKELKEQLAKEKAFVPYTYEMAKATFEQLVMDRSTLTKKPASPAPGTPGAGPNGAILPREGPPLEAVTPPVEVTTQPIPAPAQEETSPDSNGTPEVKPTEKKAEEEKPAAPAPAPDKE